MLHIYYILKGIDHDCLVIPRVIWARIDSSQDYVLQLLKLLVVEYG